MKYISKFLFLTFILATVFSCDKKDNLIFHSNGTAPDLGASTVNIAPPPADSNKVALTLAWSDAKYATDSNHVKYTIQIDSAGKNFKNAVTWTTNKLTQSFLAKELNNILVPRGYAFNVPVTMEVRVASSYANNNEMLFSNVIKIKMTPYKVPPKVALPTSSKLYLVGDATNGGWTNPVPTPSQEFSRLDETTWAGIFQLTGGKQYLLLPVNGDWGSKFAVPNNSVPGLSAGGSFQFYTSGGDNFPGPATSGWYKIVVDFQQGKFTVTPYTGVLPTNLYIVGDATAGGWTNPVPTPSQQLTRLNSSEWQITIPLTGGKEYLLLPLNGDWGHKYSVPNKSVANLWKGGEFGYDLPDNFPGPPTSGTYTIDVNFAAPTTAANSVGKFTVQ
jgi:starch-binding outer membrane protein SusE/F